MKFFTFIFLIVLLFTACETQPSLKIATSANMQFAMEEIVTAFEKENNINVKLIVSSSGKLTSQIENGAPFDVFVAANTKYPNYLYNNGFTLSKPKVYASGQLVLWTLLDFNPNLNDLQTDKIHKIAIANPKTAPYGEATVDALKNNNIYNKIKPKLIYGESISQCNQFISTKSVDVGITNLSIVMSPKMKNMGQWTKIPSTDYTPIKQAVVIVKHTQQKENAQLFFDFLFAPKAQIILKKYGYLIE